MSESLFKIYSEFGRACSGLFAHSLTSETEGDQNLYYRAVNLSKDSFTLFPILLEELQKLSEANVASLDDWMSLDLENLKLGIDSPPILELNSIKQERVASLLKSVVFFLRSLQDVLYNLVLLAHGQEIKAKGGQQSSMQKAVSQYFQNPRSNNPVTQLIVAKCPGYPEWFKDFREVRNLIKIGQMAGMRTNTSSNGQVDFAICIQLENERLSRQRVELTLEDILNSFKHSTQIVEAYLEIALKLSAIKLVDKERLNKYNEEQCRTRITMRF